MDGSEKQLCGEPLFATSAPMACRVTIPSLQFPAVRFGKPGETKADVGHDRLVACSRQRTFEGLFHAESCRKIYFSTSAGAVVWVGVTDRQLSAHNCRSRTTAQ